MKREGRWKLTSPSTCSERPDRLEARPRTTETALVADGEPCAVIAAPDDPELADLGARMEDMLREVNIAIDFELISMPVLNSMVATGWEGLVWGGVFAGTAMEPSGAMVNGVLNGVTTWVSCIQPEELYEMALEAAGIFDVEKRAEMYQYISKSLTDDYCQIAYLPYMPGITSLAPVVKGAVTGATNYAYAFAWLDD